MIGLPANLFYNTSIPTCIIVLKKHREGRDVLFIDASKEFQKGKKQNTMSAENIDHVVELYLNREPVDKEASVAGFDIIKENGYNLNIPRYVDTFEEEEVADLAEINAELRSTREEIDRTQKELLSLMKGMAADDESVRKKLDDFMSIIGGADYEESAPN